MSKIGTSNLGEVLHLLGQKLELLDAPRLELAVCGGSALLALGLVRRTTRDVDILGRIGADQEIVNPSPLPDFLLQAATDVRLALDLPEKWINTGPADQLKAGLPDGFVSRLVKQEYGPRLALFFASRYDQIHFKLYAACDEGPMPAKHAKDLRELKPTESEMLAAAQWTLLQDDSEAFRTLCMETLKQLGYERVIGKL